MHLAPTERRQRLRAELRSCFRSLIPSPVPETPGERRALLRRIGTDGLLGPGWPVEYGGQGRGADEQFVFFDEAYRAGAPVSVVTLNTVGPTLMKYGSDDQKARFLPGILSGDLVFAIGYSEPSAGTDLAALRTRAVRDGDGWRIDGGTARRGVPPWMNGMAEALRRLRGTGVNQIPGAGRVLVTAGTGVPTSGLVLASDG